MRVSLSLLFASILSGSLLAQIQLLHYGQDLALRDRCLAAQVVHADLGGWLVTGYAPEQLAQLNATHHVLPEPAAGERLAAVFDRGARRALRGVRVLIDIGAMRLVVGPEAALAGLRSPGVFHGGVQPIDLERRYAAPQAFVAPVLPLANDPRIVAMLGQVQQANLTTHIQALSNIHTRNARSSYNAAAVQYLVAEFQKLPGITVKTETFSSTYGPNVIAELRGYEIPDEIVIVGAHFDSYVGSSGNRSPGADDNASGTATVLELARICAATPLQRTVRFGLWNAEEYGLIGSGAYATKAMQQGDKIIAYLNTDMNAYRASGDTVDVDFILNDSTTSLVQTLTTISQAYVPTLGVKQGYLGGGTSDHRSFFRQGFPAVFYFEDLDQYSPYIHSAYDDMVRSTNDMNLATLISQSVCAGLATLAAPLDVPSFTLGTSSGPSVGGTIVQVTGTSLASIESIHVGGRPVPFETTGGLRFETPVAATLGPVDVVIKNPAGPAKATFTYVATQPPALRVESPVAPGGASDLAIGGPAQGFALSFLTDRAGATPLGLVQLDIGGGSFAALLLFDVAALSQSGGTVERTLGIPPIAALRGQKFWLQAVTIDAGLQVFDKTNAATLAIQ